MCDRVLFTFAIYSLTFGFIRDSINLQKIKWLAAPVIGFVKKFSEQRVKRKHNL